MPEMLGRIIELFLKNNFFCILFSFLSRNICSSNGVSFDMKFILLKDILAACTFIKKKKKMSDSDLFRRLLGICLLYKKMDQISSLQDFVAKLESTPNRKFSDDQVVERALSDLKIKHESNNNDDDDAVEEEQNTIFTEPPLEVRNQLIEDYNSVKMNKSTCAFSKADAEKKFSLKTAVIQPDLGTPCLVDSTSFFISSAPGIVFDVLQDERFLRFNRSSTPTAATVQVFVGEWDEQGVFLFQAFNDAIADYALEHQSFRGCPQFNPTRMTWAKPSFAWMLYRSGYGRKAQQNRVLKIKISHQALASLLSQCHFVDTNKDTKSATSNGSSTNDDDSSADSSAGLVGRVQWDPERDLFAPDPSNKVPREMLRRRAIQIGLQGKLSAQYVESILSVRDVTALARKIGDIHQSKLKIKKEDAVAALMQPESEFSNDFPKERPYFPALCSNAVLVGLGMLPGTIANAVAGLGRGKAG